jgi:hypothetical protein
MGDMDEGDGDKSHNALHRGNSSAGSPDSAEELGSPTYLSDDAASSPGSEGSGFGDSLYTLDELLAEYLVDIIAGSATAVPPQLTADVPDNGHGAIVPFGTTPTHVSGHGPLVSFQIDPLRNFDHYIANVRGKSHEFHVSDRHYSQLGAGELRHNPQRPNDICHLQEGYQAIVLTYTRDKLEGRFLKMENDIPPWGL